MSKRNRIIEYIYSLLVPHQSRYGSIFTSHVKALDLAEIPCVIVTIPTEESEIHAHANHLELKKSATLSIQALVAGEEESEILLHQIAFDLEQLLLSDDSMGDLISRIVPSSLEISTNLEGETPLGVAVLKFDVTYFEMVRPIDIQTQEFKKIQLEINHCG